MFKKCEISIMNFFLFVTFFYLLFFSFISHTEKPKKYLLCYVPENRKEPKTASNFINVYMNGLHETDRFKCTIPSPIRMMVGLIPSHSNKFTREKSPVWLKTSNLFYWYLTKLSARPIPSPYSNRNRQNQTSKMHNWIL